MYYYYYVKIFHYPPWKFFTTPRAEIAPPPVHILHHPSANFALVPRVYFAPPTKSPKNNHGFFFV